MLLVMKDVVQAIVFHINYNQNSTHFRSEHFFFKGPTKQKKNCHKNTHLAAVFDCRTIIVGFYNVIIQLACAYNIDDLYHTGRIDPPGMEKVVYIVCAYYAYIHRICMWLLHSHKAWAANIAIEWLPCPSIQRDKLWIISKLKVKIKNPA